MNCQLKNIFPVALFEPNTFLKKNRISVQTKIIIDYALVPTFEMFLKF